MIFISAYARWLTRPWLALLYQGRGVRIEYTRGLRRPYWGAWS